MAKLFDLDGLILGLSETGLTQRSIADILRSQGILTSQSTVSRIVNCQGKRRQAKANGLPSPSPVKVKVQLRKAATPNVVKK